MVYFRNSINMANPMTVADQSTSKQNNPIQRNRKQPSCSIPQKVQSCDKSHTAAVDVLILIAVIAAFGFLLYPYFKLVCNGVLEICGIVKYEMVRAPLMCGSLGLSILFGIVGIWGICKCTSRKCGNLNCRGLRNAAEFDIQIETEETLKKSNSDACEKGWFELSQDHHKELEAELKKIAPPNGKAILVFRARCGCPAGRMEVSGSKKVRKIKK